MRVLLVPNTDKPEAVAATRRLAAWLEERGDEAVLVRVDAEACGLEECSVSRTEVGTPALAVALGGDGTILKAFHVLGPVDTPLLGVNLGRLGFLSGAEATEAEEAVAAALEGRAEVERRHTLQARLYADGRDAGTHFALNDVVVGRVAPSRVIDLSVHVGGRPMVEYTCDGVVVATPTGSTAYSLSAGGPVVAPEVGGLVVTPIAPHTLTARSVVCGLEEEIELTFENPRRSDACVMVDGERVPCRRRLERVVVSRSDRDVSLVRLDGRSFIDVVRTKFFSEA